MYYVLNVHIGTPVETEFSAHFVTDEKYDASYLSALPIFKDSPHSSRVNVSLFKFFINIVVSVLLWCVSVTIPIFFNFV